jgi:hypothetical protein
MVSALTSRAIDHGFEPQWGQIKYFTIGIVCFFVKQASVRSKSKDWLVENEINVFKWSEMFTR